MTATSPPSAQTIIDALSCGRSGCQCNTSAKRGRGVVHCPAHDDPGPSLSVTEKDGRVLLYCHAGCSQDAVIEALRERGLWHERRESTPPRPTSTPSGAVTRWPIRSIDGELIATHARLDTPTGKRVWWEPRLSDLGMGSVDLPLYGIERLNGARSAIVVEGEKAADALLDLNLPAVGTVTGASTIPSDDALQALMDRRLYLWPDNDDIGRQHMERIAARLADLGHRDVHVMEWPDAPEKGDAADYVALGNGVSEVRELGNRARRWEPSTESQPVDDSPGLLIKSFADVESQEVDWLWEPWLARRKLHLLGGHAGDGKSLLTCALAAAFSSCGKLPDGSTAPSLRTMFLLAEDDLADTVKPRLELHGATFDDDRILVVDAVREPDKPRAVFSLKRHVEMLSAAIVQHKIDLLIIDPLSAFTPGLDRNSEEARDLLMPLVDMAEQTNVAIVGIVHVGKPNGTNRTPLQMLMGATAYGAVARLVWMLAPVSREEDDPNRVLGIVKSNLGPKPRSLRWSLPVEDMPIQWLGDSEQSIIEMVYEGGRRDDAGMSPERREIIAFLNGSGEGHSPQQIADALEKNVSTVRNMLRSMEEAGAIIRLKTGIYTTPSHRCIDSVDSIDAESTESMESTNLWLRESLDVEEPEVIAMVRSWPDELLDELHGAFNVRHWLDQYGRDDPDAKALAIDEITKILNRSISQLGA